MSEYILIDNLRDLTSLVSNRNCDVEKGTHSVRYKEEDTSVKITGVHDGTNT